MPIATIIDKLEKAARWEDGESLTVIRARLTSSQLAATGRLILRISERGTLPWLLRARIEQNDDLLFEVVERLPASMTHARIEAMIKDWQAQGYL